MLQKINLQNVLTLDIETVSNKASYDDLNSTMQQLWDIKSEQIQRRKEIQERLSASDSYVESAGIYAEFGKIVCISVGVFNKNQELILKSFYNHDEKKLLEEFVEMLGKFYRIGKYICGHNIKEFDIPYICRRLLVNQIQLPDCLEIAGKKPWQLEHLLDTMNLWKFGDYKNYTALKLLCGLFDIPTPKDDIDGSKVGHAYWQQNDLERIKLYCKKDVIATARLLMRYKCMEIVDDSKIIYNN